MTVKNEHLTAEKIDKIFDLCSASIKFADKSNDNTYSFTCGLTLGHIGVHRESGYYNNIKYVISWSDDEVF